MKRFLLISIGFLGFSFITFQTFDPSQFTSGVYDGCPAKGSGGDSYLNSLKNRDIPPPSFESMSLSDVANLPQKLGDETGRQKKIRSEFSTEDQGLATQYEQKGVTIEGYIHRDTIEGKEECNCESTTNVDYHIWLAPLSTSAENECMNVEISPRMSSKRASWLKILDDAIKHKTKVKVSGWLMYDQEHRPLVGKSRSTLWEIHPIHSIEPAQ